MNQGETPDSNGPAAPRWTPTVLPGSGAPPSAVQPGGPAAAAHPDGGYPGGYPGGGYPGTAATETSRFGGPAVPPLPRQHPVGAWPGAVPSQFGPPAASLTGAYHGRPYGQVPPARRGLSGAALALIIAPVLLILGGVAAAVVVPKFSSRGSRAQWSATTITLPDTVLGMPRQQALEAAQGAQVLSQLPTGSQLAVYSDGGSAVVVVVAVRSPSPQSEAAQKVTWLALERSLGQSAMSDVQLVDRDPGAFDGRFACGSNTQVSMCLATDAAVTMAVMAGGAVPGGIEAVASVRAQVERRGN